MQGKLRPDMVLPAPFLQFKSYGTPGGSGVLADPSKLTRNFVNLGFFFSVVLAGVMLIQMALHTRLSARLPMLPEVSLLSSYGRTFV